MIKIQSVPLSNFYSNVECQDYIGSIESHHGIETKGRKSQAVEHLL